MDLNKNRPDAEFMEKILLDFGISGNIKKINNGPVVSLYEFEPAPGVKVSKIINLLMILLVTQVQHQLEYLLYQEKIL